MCGRHSPGRTWGPGTQTTGLRAPVSSSSHLPGRAGSGSSGPQRRPQGWLRQKGRWSVLRTFRLRFPLGRVPLPPWRSCSGKLSETRNSQQCEGRVLRSLLQQNWRSGFLLWGVTVLKGHCSVDGVQKTRSPHLHLSGLETPGSHSINARAHAP